MPQCFGNTQARAQDPRGKLGQGGVGCQIRALCQCHPTRGPPHQFAYQNWEPLGSLREAEANLSPGTNFDIQKGCRPAPYPDSR